MSKLVESSKRKEKESNIEEDFEKIAISKKLRTRSQNIQECKRSSIRNKSTKQYIESDQSSANESVSTEEEYKPSSDDDEADENENEEESEESENEDDEEEDKNEKPTTFSAPAQSSKSRNTRQSLAVQSKKSNYTEYCIQGDYFESSSQKTHTSNHTLDRLKNPRLDPKMLRKLTKNQSYLSKEHDECLKRLYEKSQNMFSQWQFALEEGFSVLLYGLGSKRNLLNDFYEMMVSEHPAVFVNGFFPSLTLKEILDVIIVDLLGMESTPKADDCLKIIESTLRKNPQDRLYLIINNIDGPQLRTNKMQDFFSRLAAVPNIHLVASVDHINAPLMWDNMKRSRFNFFWCDATTFLPYGEETSYESSMLVEHGGALALASLESVFRSLTPNAQKMYIILIKYQLKNGYVVNYSGMSFKELYHKGRELFVVSSDSMLRALLTEYTDHVLVKIKRGTDGIEYLSVPLEKDALKHFLEQHDSN